jgi:hypothetical protein
MNSLKWLWVVGSVVICLFSSASFAGLSARILNDTNIMVNNDGTSTGTTTVKLYIAYSTKSEVKSRRDCIYKSIDIPFVGSSISTTASSKQAQANAAAEISLVEIGGEISANKSTSSSNQFSEGYLIDISSLNSSRAIQHWWINAVGLNNKRIVVDNSGWNISSGSKATICMYDVEKECNFHDMNGLNEIQISAILDLCRNQIMDGYPDKSIQPDNPIKRSEFAKIIAKADGFKENAKPNNLQGTSFTDVPEDQWYYKYVVYVHSKSLMQGDNNKGEIFRPADGINRAEAIKTIHAMSKDIIMSYLDSNNCVLNKGGTFYCPQGSNVSLENIGCPAIDTQWYCTSVSYLKAMDCLTDDYMSSQEELFRSITRKEAFAILNCVITKTEG